MLFNLIKFGFDVAKHAEEEKKRKIIEAMSDRTLTGQIDVEKLRERGITLADLKDGVYEIKIED